jgi:hypothetical protein
MGAAQAAPAAAAQHGDNRAAGQLCCRTIVLQGAQVLCKGIHVWAVPVLTLDP